MRIESGKHMFQYLLYKVDNTNHLYVLREKDYMKLLINNNNIITDVEHIYLNYIKRLYENN